MIFQLSNDKFCKPFNRFSKPLSVFIFLISVVISPITYAETEECYSTKEQPNYASDTSRYINASGAYLDMNQALQAIKLEQNNAYYRVLDNSNKVLFDKLYDILVYSDGYILAKRDGKLGLIDDNGRLVYDFEYDAIDRLNDGQVLVSKYQKGQLTDVLMDGKGQSIYPKSEVFEPNLRITALYYDVDTEKGYFQIDKDNKSGLIDDAGEIIIPIIYDEMDSMDHCTSGDFILKVRRDHQIGLIDHNNKFVVPLRAKQSISSFSTIGYEPFILSIESARQGIADALHWSPNKADVMSEQLINPKGEILITSDTPIKSLGGNLYKFSNNGKVGVINDWAEIVLDTYYDDITFEYDSPLIAQRAGKFGILNTDQSGDTLKVRHYFDSLERIEDQSVIEAAFATTYVTSIEAADSVVVEGEINAEIDGYNYVLPDEVFDTFDQNDIKYSVSSSLEHDYYANRSPQAYIASSNDKYGVIANSGLVIIPFEYDSIREVGEIFIVKQADKYGVLDFQGNIIQPIAFDNIQDSDNGFFILFKEDQQAIMNTAGDIKFTLSDTRLRVDMMEYPKALIPIEQDGLFGYLNKERTAVAIEPIYEKVELIGDQDSFIGQKNGRKQLINADNSVIKVNRSSDYHILDNIVVNDETAFVVASVGKQGIINANGEVLLPFDYESIGSFLVRQYDQDYDSYDYTRYFIVKQDGLFGLLDSNLKAAISPTYKYLARLKNHPYFVVANSISESKQPVKYGLIDIKGNIVKSVEYDAISIDPDNDDYIIVKKGSKVEYYNEKVELGLDVVVIEEAF